MATTDSQSQAQLSFSPLLSGSEALADTYHPLFADPTADTVLRSAEGILFRIPAHVLRRTTGYFAVTLPPASPLNANTAHDAQPIPQTEPAPLLVRALRILCGLPPSGSALDFATAESLLALAEHWAAPALASYVRSAITGPPFLAQPLRLYALCARAGWADEAHIAARATLGLSLFDEAKHEEVLKGMSVGPLMELLRLHRRRRDLLDRMLSGKMEAEDEAVIYLKEKVSGKCAACGAEGGDYLWRQYRARIFVEMDVRPLGDTITGAGVDEWHEALACWGAKCTGKDCGKTLYDRDAILPEIKACINRLPDTV
ncbi:hypothetical protein DFH06DRAFT_999058 [Mycena polygramma]|nr:hypothetical protein DFH06DRAFT_999058 [Mycena polygramma]